MKNFIPKFYQNLYSNTGKKEFIFGKLEQKLINFLKIFKFKKDAIALDLGCGDGRNLIYLAKKNFKVSGIDNSSTGLKEIEKRIHNTSYYKNIRLKNADLKTVKLKSNNFDFIICIYALHEIGAKGVKHIIKQTKTATKSKGVNYLAFFLPKQGTFLRKESYYPKKSVIMNLYKDWKILSEKMIFLEHSHQTPYSGGQKIKHKHYVCHLFLQKP